jgi:hypothetical protein
MKKIFVIKKICFVVVGLVCLNLSAQSRSEADEIISSVDIDALNKIREDVLKEDKRNDSIVNAFCLATNVPKIIRRGDKVMQIVQIFNGKPVYKTTFNAQSAIVSRTNFVQPGGALGLDLDGDGMYIGVWDGGSPRPTHVEFGVFGGGSRVEVPNIDSSLGIINHATHVTGTLGAQGFNASSRGMAQAADIIAYDWTGDRAEVADEIVSKGMLVSNHSYGFFFQGNPPEGRGTYTNLSRSWDQIAVSAPYYLMVAAAGNDGAEEEPGGAAPGYDKLQQMALAKNNMVVANANNPSVDATTGEMSSLFINTSSSQGPADDGRIKPDITADGTSVLSTSSAGDSQYAALTGTSMASPNVAGSLLLMQQYYNQLYSNFMLSATLKGLACHTADDDDFSAGPDPIFGWGLLNIKKMAETIEDSASGNSLISEEVLSNGTSYTYNFIANGTSPIVATICWTDPPGTDRTGNLNDTTPVLINDLDLRINDNTTTYMPWKLNVANVAQAATMGDNVVDNIERINIDTAAIGSYSLTVTHKGILQGGSQPFSLVLTGADLVLSNGVEKNYEDFSIWPNPSRGEFNINFKNRLSDNIKIDVYDMSGRLVYNKSFSNLSSRFNETIKLTNVQSGIYIATISEGSNVKSHKLVIE